MMPVMATIHAQEFESETKGDLIDSEPKGDVLPDSLVAAVETPHGTAYATANTVKRWVS